MDVPAAVDLTAWYRRYLARCNEHAFDRLGEFVAEDVHVNGEPQSLSGYVSGLQAVVRAFPDYHWDLRHLFVDGCRISAHFLDTGIHQGSFLGVPPTGRGVEIQEFAVYRVAAGKIVEVWVTADNQGLMAQLA